MRFLNTIKFSKWWRPKIGTGIFTWILFSVLFNEKHQVEISLKALLLFILLIILGVLGHLINDASDYHQDLKAGKSNIFSKIGYRKALWLIPIGTLVIFFIAYQLNTFILFLTILQIFFNCLYSFPLVRLKERKWWALIITGFYERTIPYSIILFYLIAPADLTMTQISFLAIYFVWAYLWECRNFINGQLKDVENDKISNVFTFAIQIGSKKLNKVKRIILTVEIIFLLTWFIFFFFINFFFQVTFSIGIFFILTMHYLSNDQLYYLSTFEKLIDANYTHLFFASLLISAYIFDYINVVMIILLLIMFSSGLTFALINYIKSKIIKLYYFLFGIASYVVNHLIYYFRRIFRNR